MLRWYWLGLAALTACGFRSPNSSGGDGSTDAALTDGSMATDAGPSFCFGSFVEICLVAAPGPAITVNSGETRTINTQADSPDCVATTSDVGACVVAAASITVNGTLRGTGPRPLVLLAAGSITVNTGGVIDVASHRGGSDLGAGANPQPRCVAGATPTGATGGWGGSNASKGGDGNRAGGNSTGGNAADALPRPAAALFGGCAGGKGAGGSAGNGGAGGGAVDLIAATIVIDAKINASGAGADGAGGGGGGGGGSGGLIVLDAPEVTINGAAQVLAQGGGGGEGGPSGGAGGDPATPGQAPAGGRGGGSGGDGGNGATTGNGSNGGNDGGLPFDGGGGGGGGRGFIITTDPTPPSVSTSQVCPAFS